MLNFQNKEVNLTFLINPFYIYCATFSISIFLYSWGWSSLYPEITYPLILFFIFTFGISAFFGRVLNRFHKLNLECLIRNRNHFLVLDIVFFILIFMGILDIYLTGYLPVLDRTRNHLEFGFPVLDPLYNSLSIFFTVFIFQTFLESRKKKYIIYFVMMIVFHLLIFRRSTVIWILTASSFVYILNRKQIRTIFLLISLCSIPLISYGFGIYGNIRNSLGKSYIINELGASEQYKNSEIDANHYLTYLYFSSPLANLQSTIDQGDGFINNGELRDLLFYCFIPESLTLHLEKTKKLSEPNYALIHPHLIVGSFFILSYYTLGWLGMIFMYLFLILYIIACIGVIRRWDTFRLTTYSILVTAVSLLTFSNFLNRLDVILTLFVYPVVFHYVFKVVGEK